MKDYGDWWGCGCRWKHEEVNESSSPKGTWDGLKVGEVAGEGSGPLPHVCTAPGSWGGGGELSPTPYLSQSGSDI